MKQVITNWVKVKEGSGCGMYEHEQRVVYSDHPRWEKGDRFDWGFSGIVITQGYQLIINGLEQVEGKA